MNESVEFRIAEKKRVYIQNIIIIIVMMMMMIMIIEFMKMM